MVQFVFISYNTHRNFLLNHRTITCTLCAQVSSSTKKDSVIHACITESFLYYYFFNCFMSVLMDRKSIIIETSTDKLLSHLFSNFLSKILFLLLKAFTSLETNEFFNCNFSAVCFGYFCYILCYCLFSVLSFYINLIK